MKIHEYQAKELFRDYGIPVSPGILCKSAEEVKEAYVKLGGKVVIKAQIHAGGRGKAGGIKVANSPEEAEEFASKLLGSRLVTHQTGKEGKVVRKVLVEKATSIKKELYVSMILDRSKEQLTFMASSYGGVDIEEVSKKNREAIITQPVPDIGFMPFIGRKIGYRLNFSNEQVKEFTKILNGIYKLFTEKDASLVEINPLVIDNDGKFVAVDAKINFDDNALFKHPEIAGLRDVEEENPEEVLAQEHGLNYIKLSGSVGCMVNGAGLAMATMDIIKLYGGEPANFLDVGGSATSERVEVGFKILVSDKNVKSILVNIFGGIVRCDVVASGIVNAAKKLNLNIPVVVRLQGTNHELGKKIIQKAGMKIIPATDLKEAARLAVLHAKD